MKLISLDIHRVKLPLVTPFRTSFGTQSVRDIMLLHIVTDIGDGWGECAVGEEPLYNEEFVDGAQMVIEHWLLPLLKDAGEFSVGDVPHILGKVKGNRGAKAALEMALIDAHLKSINTPLSTFLGGVRPQVEVGVSVGIPESLDALVPTVGAYVEQGYKRVKLKIEPGFDIEPVRVVRDAFPNLMLQCDANASYTAADIAHLQGLDQFNMILIEQPFADDDLKSHAILAQAMTTPICLDESVVSLNTAIDAVERGAADIINIKLSRVGGILEAKAIHDYCTAESVPVWCGGMLESGVGRAANVALASLTNFLLPGDISASNRYFARDVITEPFMLDGSSIAVPTGPGLGVVVDEAFLTERGAVVVTL
jgi:O-succinylbenzoate synthase